VSDDQAELIEKIRKANERFSDENSELQDEINWLKREIAERDIEIRNLQESRERLRKDVVAFDNEADLLRQCVEDLVIFVVVEANRQRMTGEAQYLHDSHVKLILKAYKAIGVRPRIEWVSEYIRPAIIAEVGLCDE